MTIDKFQQIVIEECSKVEGLPIINPSVWKEVKPKLENFIREVDKIVEVFEMENTPKKDK